MKMKTGLVLDPKGIRCRLGMTQQEFWSKIGVTQSGGSRYEAGRPMPKPVQELLRVVHIECIDLATINRMDFEIANYLRVHEPELRQRLTHERTTLTLMERGHRAAGYPDLP